jgi:superfamily II DNA or RNA helicase
MHNTSLRDHPSRIVDHPAEDDRSSLQLRPYQQEALKAVRDGVRSQIHRQLLQLPTGCGKTVIFAEAVRRRPGRAIVLVHRDELAQQALDKVSMVCPTARVGLVKAEQDDIDADVVIASVQTVSRENRLARLANGRWATIVVDEAHHAAASSYRSVIDRLAGPTTLVLGVTATPSRGDGVGLDRVFDKLVFSRTLPEMIAAGYLADLRAIQVSVDGLDLSHVAVRGGDFAEGALGDALEDAHLPAVVAKSWVEHAAERRGLVFFPTVALAHASATELQSAGVAAEALDGTTPRDERRAILRRYHTGETAVVTNCGVLTEGYDEPAVDCIVMARPTRSQGLYLQMLGRGTRPFPGKTDCLILDLVGSTSRHDLITLADLAGVDPATVARKGVTEALAERPFQGAIPGTWAAELDTREVDLFRRRPMAWVRAGDRWILSTGNGTVSLEPTAGKWTVVERSRRDPPVRVAEGLPLEWAQGVGEDVVRRRGGLVLARSDAPWRARPASSKQLAALRRMRIHVGPYMTAGEASDLISARCARMAS